MKLLIINGPNLNMLGIREPEIYGHETYRGLCEFIENRADALGVQTEIFQSNSEGDDSNTHSAGIWPRGRHSYKSGRVHAYERGDT